MLSYGTMRKLVKATASRLGTSEKGVFIVFARSQGWSEDSENVGEGNYALYCEDSYDDEEELENFCLGVLCNNTVKIKEVA